MNGVKDNTIDGQCSKCGKCCRHIAGILPEFDLGDGTCCHLTEDGLCDIYDERPLICNVDRFFEECLKGKIRREDWYALNHKACNDL